jgi:hypothetical protein
VKYSEWRCFAVSASWRRLRVQAGCFNGTKARMSGTTWYNAVIAPRFLLRVISVRRL